MTTNRLLEKIAALPPEKREEVEHFVDALCTDTAPREESGDLIERLRVRRERLRREHGLFDSVPVIRELRETGP